MYKRSSSRPLRHRQHAALWLLGAMIWLAFAAAAQAATCPRPGPLGTSRTLSVDSAATPRLGLKSFPQTLPLADHEVVLTFDDGPWPHTTKRVLAALAQECVRADLISDRKASIGISGPRAPDRGRRSYRRPSHMVPPQPDADQTRPDCGGNRSWHLGGRNGPTRCCNRHRHSISCNRAESWCSEPIFGRATGTE
jgi:hypothetical protein